MIQLGRNGIHQANVHLHNPPACGTTVQKFDTPRTKVEITMDVQPRVSNFTQYERCPSAFAKLSEMFGREARSDCSRTDRFAIDPFFLELHLAT